MMYNKEYYETNNYVDYFERTERYYHLAKDLKVLLESLSLYTPFTSILDYGCAFGFLIEGFKKLGHDELRIVGYDISEYSTKIGTERGNLYLKSVSGFSNILIALDVFEHMKDEELCELFYNFDSNILIGRIPVAFNGESCYHLNISRQDPTHINCKDKDHWKDALKIWGYKTIFHLNLPNIYDSPGVFSFIAFKGKL